ncbi:MAG: hypothetical protein R2702_12350 [Acidimicrobiales bacterium]
MAAFTPPGAGRHDDQLVGVAGRLAAVDEDGHRREVVDRDVEEALDLAGVEVDRHDPVRRRR